MWEAKWDTWKHEKFDYVTIKAPNVESCQKVCRSSKEAKANNILDKPPPECKGWVFDFDTLSCYIFTYSGYDEEKLGISYYYHQNFDKVQKKKWNYGGLRYAGPRYCP